MTIKRLRFRPERCTRCTTCGYGCSVRTVRAAESVGSPPTCDLCFGDPACAVACPTGAFEWVDVEPLVSWAAPPMSGHGVTSAS